MFLFAVCVALMTTASVAQRVGGDVDSVSLGDSVSDRWSCSALTTLGMVHGVHGRTSTDSASTASMDTCEYLGIPYGRYGKCLNPHVLREVVFTAT